MMIRADDLMDDALDSLGAAKDLLTDQPWAKVCFLSQQASELAVKSALNAMGKERRSQDVYRPLQKVNGGWNWRSEKGKKPGAQSLSERPKRQYSEHAQQYSEG
jgi:HEPN domain-containing protein